LNLGVNGLFHEGGLWLNDIGGVKVRYAQRRIVCFLINSLGEFGPVDSFVDLGAFMAILLVFIRALGDFDIWRFNCLALREGLILYLNLSIEWVCSTPCL
jgi:hypothetical protein